MNLTYAKVVLDSTCNGKRLITIECKYWRAIHSEIMTHRDRARNAMSSRAIPFLRLIKPEPGRNYPGNDIFLENLGDTEYKIPAPNCIVLAARLPAT